MKVFKVILLIILIILLILLILWLLSRRKSIPSAGKHEKASEVSPEKESGSEIRKDMAKSEPAEPARAAGKPESGSNINILETESSRSAVRETGAEGPAQDKASRRAVSAVQQPEASGAPEMSDAEMRDAVSEAINSLMGSGNSSPEDPEEFEEEISADSEPDVSSEPDVVSAAESAAVSEVKAEIDSSAAAEPAVTRNSADFSLLSANQRASALKELGGFTRIIALNVETPNSLRDRICNVGITVGDTEKCLSTNVTINPEEDLDDVPDGMTAEQILSSPTLPELWPGMSRLFDGALIIAHNASYDLNILKKALNSYGLSAPSFSQACTYRMSRKFHPDFDSYKLGSICENYGIPLDITNAVSHSDACFDIFCKLVDEGHPVFDEAKPFTL